MQLLFRLLTKLWLCCKNLYTDPNLSVLYFVGTCPVDLSVIMLHAFYCSVTMLTNLLTVSQLGTTVPRRNLMRV